MRFQVNSDLLHHARRILGTLPRLYWITGGACSGKTTLCRYLAGRHDLELIDMDARIFGSFAPRYTPERHPASREWFGQPNGLAWVLSLDWPAFNALNAATNAEYLDLLAEELAQYPPDRPLLVDGGIARPSLLTEVLPADRLLCLSRPERTGADCWEKIPERLEMKKMILALEEGEAAWRTFLDLDEKLTRTLLAECRACGIPVMEISRGETVAETGEKVAKHFALK